MTGTSRLRVLIHDVLAGHLVRNDEGSTFRLDEDYIAQAHRPVLGQVFEDEPDREHRANLCVPRWFATCSPRARCGCCWPNAQGFIRRAPTSSRDPARGAR